MSWWWNKGGDDKSQNQGQVDPNKFSNDTDRKNYQAGYERQRQKEEEERRRQREQQNKK